MVTPAQAVASVGGKPISLCRAFLHWTTTDILLNFHQSNRSPKVINVAAGLLLQYFVSYRKAFIRICTVRGIQYLSYSKESSCRTSALINQQLFCNAMQRTRHARPINRRSHRTFVYRASPRLYGFPCHTNQQTFMVRFWRFRKHVVDV